MQNNLNKFNTLASTNSNVRYSKMKTPKFFIRLSGTDAPAKRLGQSTFMDMTPNIENSESDNKDKLKPIGSPMAISRNFHLL